MNSFNEVYEKFQKSVAKHTKYSFESEQHKQDWVQYGRALAVFHNKTPLDQEHVDGITLGMCTAGIGVARYYRKRLIRAISEMEYSGDSVGRSN